MSSPGRARVMCETCSIWSMIRSSPLPIASCSLDFYAQLPRQGPGSRLPHSHAEIHMVPGTPECALRGKLGVYTTGDHPGGGQWMWSTGDGDVSFEVRGCGRQGQSLPVSHGAGGEQPLWGSTPRASPSLGAGASRAVRRVRETPGLHGRPSSPREHRCREPDGGRELAGDGALPARRWAYPGSPGGAPAVPRRRVGRRYPGRPRRDSSVARCGWGRRDPIRCGVAAPGSDD